MTSKLRNPGADALFAGPGEMRALCRSIDWSATSLGSVERWPGSLRTAVQLCMGSPVAMAVWGGAGRVLVYNDSYAPALGRGGHPRALGRPGRELPARLWDWLGPEIERVTGEGEPSCNEAQSIVLERDGREEEACFTFSHTPICEDDGRIVGALTIAQPSMRRLASAVEHDGEGLLRSLGDQIPGGAIYRQRQRKGRIEYLYMSAGIESILGLTAEQTMADPDSFRRLVIETDRARFVAAEEKSARQLTTFDCLCRQRTVDGALKWVQYRSMPRRLTDGSTEWNGLLVDVTDRKVAEDVLSEQKERLDLAMHSGAIGAWHLDIAEDIRVFDDQVCDLLGIAPATFTGSVEEFVRVVHPDDRPKIRAALELTIREGAPYSPDYRAILPDGSIRHVAARGRLIRDEAGRPRRVLGILYDITERKQMEEALRDADHRKNEFLAVLSHELRNPLAPIRNSAHILAKGGALDERGRRATTVIQRQVSHLAHLVDDLLDITRISRGKIRLQRTKLDLVELVRRAVDDHRSVLEHHQVGTDFPQQPAVIEGDPTRLAQVVGNLLQNAVKFTPVGGTISVSLKVVEGSVKLEVADSGVGIEREMLGRLFVPFMQADQALDRSLGGLGLGLAFAKGIVDLHGGRVGAESDGPGRGARFIVSLPQGRPELGPEPSTPSEPAPASRDRSVLIIEDNKDAADSLGEIIELAGHRVAVAYSGTEGLRKARELRPDIVLCDIGLPEMDGYAVARAFRFDDALSTTYLVALTGYAQPEDERQALRAGFDAHMAKPPLLEALEALVRDAPVKGAALSSQPSFVGRRETA